MIRSLVRVGKQTPQEYRFDPPPKANDAVDLDHRHPFMVDGAESGIGVDIYQARHEAMRTEQLSRIVAQMTTVSGIDDDVFRSVLAHGPDNRKVCENTVCFV